MTKGRISFKSKRKLQQRIVFGIVAFVLSAGLLVSSLNFIPGLNGTQAGYSPQETVSAPTAAELEEKSKASPQDVSLLKELAAAYSAEGQADKAVEAYEKAVSLSPDNEELKTRLAGSIVAAGQYDKAQKSLEELISSNPNNKEAHLYYGYTLSGKQDFAGAIAHFEKYVGLAGENDPETPRVKSLIETLRPLVKQ